MGAAETDVLQLGLLMLPLSAGGRPREACDI